MTRKLPPTILLIDDEDTSISSTQHLATKQIVRTRALHPRDVDLKDLSWASLVLIDFKLDSWSERDNLPSISLKPKDGLALASVLRRQIENKPGTSPTAFAIYTGQIQDLASPLPPENRNHALARINNLEWVFEKGKTISAQVASLAKAVEELPQSWSIKGRYPRERLAELLRINKESKEADQLLQDVEMCLPPIHELSEWSHGLAILRWLLHRILPYPCFLWDSHHLAARLRVNHRALLANRRLQEKLNSCRYKGILADFLGPRWWRSKVELFLWEATKGSSSDVKEVRKVVSRFVRISTDDSVPTHPIVCVDADYQPLEVFSPTEEAVRIQPDDWPAYADQAWTTIKLARADPRLGALVIREDQEKSRKIVS